MLYVTPQHLINPVTSEKKKTYVTITLRMRFRKLLAESTGEPRKKKKLLLSTILRG